MSKIINFPIDRTVSEKLALKTSRKSPTAEKCDIIIFPGVRIERKQHTVSQHANALLALRKQAGKTKDN